VLKRILKLFWQREIITYLIAGVLATLVNLLVFMLLSQVFGPERWYLTNAPAISAALLFAFFTNRWFVFRSKGPVWLEFRRFVGSRILISLLFEYGAMYLFIQSVGHPVGNSSRQPVVIGEQSPHPVSGSGRQLCHEQAVHFPPSRPRPD